MCTYCIYYYRFIYCFMKGYIMKNKRCLRLLVITLALVVSMFSNVFASSYGYWTCVSQHNSKYPVGTQLSCLSNLDIRADIHGTEYCKFDSNFEVEEGDLLSLSFGAFFSGNENEFDGSASDCVAKVISENGDVIANINFELNGNLLSCYERKDVYITKETAGKIRFYIHMECPGPVDVSTELNELFVEINGEEL